MILDMIDYLPTRVMHGTRSKATTFDLERATEASHLKIMYNDKRVITLNDFPDLKHNSN